MHVLNDKNIFLDFLEYFVIVFFLIISLSKIKSYLSQFWNNQLWFFFKLVTSNKIKTKNRQSTSKQCSWKQKSTQLPQSSISDEQLITDAIKKLRNVMSSAQFRHVERFTFASKTSAKISQSYSKKYVVFFWRFFVFKYTKAIKRSTFFMW